MRSHALGISLAFAVFTAAAGAAAAKKPAPKPKSAAVVGMALGNTHTCLRLSDGTVSCVGSDFTQADAPPVAAHWQGLDGVKALWAGGVMTCVTLKDRSECFVMGSQPGAALALPAGTTQVALSPGLSCARTGDGHVSCWGADVLGDGRTDAEQATPLVLPGLDGVEEVAVAGGNRGCVRLKGGAVRCWGNADPLGVAADACKDFMCPGGCGHGPPPGAVGARTWGSGPILVGAVPRWRVCAKPVDVAALAGATRLALFVGTTCGLMKNGSVTCVGQGQKTPVAKLAGLDHVQTVGFGWDFGCALIAGGTVRCFGANNSGQLGDGTNTRRDDAKPVPGLANVVELAVGAVHACARTKAGAVLCWGSNHPGQLGDGTRQDRNVPTEMKR